MLEELWEEFNSMERYGGMSLSCKRRPLLTMYQLSKSEGQRKVIKLEDDLLVLGMERYYYIEDLNTLDQNTFEYGMKEFVSTHQEDFHYFNERFMTTSNIADKWRYALLCWFYGRRNIHLLDDAIEILLNCTNKCKLEGNYFQSVKMLSCSYNLSSIYNRKEKFSRAVAREAFSLINSIKDTNNSRWILEPTRILTKLDILNHHSASYLLSLLQEEGHRFVSRGIEGRLEQTFLLLSKGLCEFLNVNIEEKIELERIIQLQIAWCTKLSW